MTTWLSHPLLEEELRQASCLLIARRAAGDDRPFRQRARLLFRADVLYGEYIWDTIPIEQHVENGPPLALDFRVVGRRAKSLAIYASAYAQHPTFQLDEDGSTWCKMEMEIL